MIEVKDLNDVPEKYRADYIEVEKDGVKIFQHKDFLTVIGAMKRKGEERDTLANELKGYKSKEAERVAEAERKALEKLKVKFNMVALLITPVVIPNLEGFFSVQNCVAEFFTQFNFMQFHLCIPFLSSSIFSCTLLINM